MSDTAPTMRAKFWVESVTKFKDGERLNLCVVTYDTDENKSFSKYTPTGNITLSITNENLFGKFEPGDEFYIDFTKAV